jgi:hypothetical protein
MKQFMDWSADNWPIYSIIGMVPLAAIYGLASEPTNTNIQIGMLVFQGMGLFMLIAVLVYKKGDL